MTIFSTLAFVFCIVILIGVLLQNLLAGLQILLAFRAFRRGVPITLRKQLWQRYGDIGLPISLIVPAYNEEATVAESVRALMALRYPVIDIVVVNDGSKDNTLETLIAEFALHPVIRAHGAEVPHQPIRKIYGSDIHANLIVVDKENGGKADAVNAGINLSRRPLFCVVDADSLLETDALLRAVEPFLDDPERVVAVGGTIRIVNGCQVQNGRVVKFALPKSKLALFQCVEYLRAFLIARLAWSELNALAIVSGAFGIFRRDIVVTVGGFDRHTVGEDFEIIMRIHRHLRDLGRDYRICFIPEPICWTEAPSSFDVLRRQRVRWQRGAMETFAKHRSMLFNPRYGRIGFLAMGNLFVTDILGPAFEALGIILFPLLWAAGYIDVSFIFALFAALMMLGVAVSVGSLILEELEIGHTPTVRELLLLALAAVLENFGYRQINNLWRILGMWQYFRGAKHGWGEMTRKGFSSS